MNDTGSIVIAVVLKAWLAGHHSCEMYVAPI